MGKLYGLGFDYYSKRLYCSKFVYDVYQSALNIEVGKKETFKELIEANPEASKTFWRFWFFGFIPWKRITVTPASQYEDERLETAFENVEG
jgi:hypothetical protein